LSCSGWLELQHCLCELQERARLDIVSEFHLGDFVNKFTPGSLVMLPSEAGDDAETTTAPHCSNRQIFVTISGAIGVVFNVSPALFGFLNRLQTSMRQVVRGIGGFSHAEWRSWSNNLRIPSPLVETERSSRGFVDGDLVEAFLELNRCAGVGGAWHCPIQRSRCVCAGRKLTRSSLCCPRMVRVAQGLENQVKQSHSSLCSGLWRSWRDRIEVPMCLTSCCDPRDEMHAC
jgi:hypothetical protein